MSFLAHPCLQPLRCHIGRTGTGKSEHGHVKTKAQERDRCFRWFWQPWTEQHVNTMKDLRHSRQPALQFKKKFIKFLSNQSKEHGEQAFSLVVHQLMSHSRVTGFNSQLWVPSSIFLQVQTLGSAVMALGIECGRPGLSSWPCSSPSYHGLCRNEPADGRPLNCSLSVKSFFFFNGQPGLWWPQTVRANKSFQAIIQASFPFILSSS